MGDTLDSTAIEPFVSDWMADEGVPGASVAIVDVDGRRYASGFGARDLETNAPATPATRYGVGSCTKSVTALAVARLVDAGELSFDDRVADHVSHYGAAPEITVHDLLTHTSGYPSDGSAVALIARTLGVDHEPVPLSDDDDFARHLAGAAGERAPGHFFYNNAGYTVLARVVEAVADEPFARYVSGAVLEPLGMDRATFAHDALQDGDAMTPYRLADGTPVPEAFPFDELKHAPGGLVAPVTDLGRYLRTYLNGGELDGERVVTAGTLSRLTDSHATRRTMLDDREQGYGYGWMVEPFLDDRLISHGGSVAVSTAWIGYLEDAGVGVAVASNTAPAIHPVDVGMGILALLEDERPTSVVPGLALDEKLDRVTGSYESYRGIASADVERRGGGLAVTITTELSATELALHPERTDPDATTFTAVTDGGAELPVEFASTDDGMDMFVDRWRLHRV